MAVRRLQEVKQQLIQESEARQDAKWRKEAQKRAAIKRAAELKQISAEIRAVAEHRPLATLVKSNAAQQQPDSRNSSMQFKIKYRGLGTDARHTTSTALAHRRASFEASSSAFLCAISS